MKIQMSRCVVDAVPNYCDFGQDPSEDDMDAIVQSNNDGQVGL